MPKPLKYHNLPMETTYKEIEREAIEVLLAMLPEELRCEYSTFLLPDRDDAVVAEALILVKAADCFSAYIKCLDEQKVGNREFERARVEVGERLDAFGLPEVDWFKKNALPAYAKSLDEINFDFNLNTSDCGDNAF